MKAQYQTKQRNELLLFLEKNSGKHFTALEIQIALKREGISIGIATIYRQLEKMTNEGYVLKYANGPHTSTCYEYLKPGSKLHSAEEFHCKCVRCGALIHIECKELSGLGDHLLECHHFLMDPRRTVFYGLCENCQKTEQTSGREGGSAGACLS